jgi:hypothetical protein
VIESERDANANDDDKQGSTVGFLSLGCFQLEWASERVGQRNEQPRLV